MNMCEDTSILDQRPSILLMTVTTDLSHSWITETRVAISEVWAMFINFCSSFHSSNLAAKNVFHQWYMAVQVAGYECSSETLHTLQSSSRAKGGGTLPSVP